MAAARRHVAGLVLLLLAWGAATLILLPMWFLPEPLLPDLPLTPPGGGKKDDIIQHQGSHPQPAASDHIKNDVTGLPGVSVAVCSVVRDEAEALVGWLEFHLQILGVQRVFLYDHQSQDEDLALLLKPFIEAQSVVLIDWSHCDAASATERTKVTNCQLDAFAHYLVTYGSLSQWTMFTDVDEYVFFSDPKDARLLPDLLKDYEDEHSLALTSVSFGSSHHIWKPAGPVVMNYQLRTALLYEQVRQSNLSSEGISEDQYYEEMFKIKSIVRSNVSAPGLCGAHLFHDTRLSNPRSTKTVLPDKKPLRGCGKVTHDPAHCLRKGCSVMMPTLEPLRTNHYRVQSLEDYLEKLGKGIVQGSWERKSQAAPFYLINRNEVRDSSAAAWGKQLLLNRPRISNQPHLIIHCVGAPLSGVPLVAAVLGLAGASVGKPQHYQKCGDDSYIQCSPYLYPLGFWNHRLVGEMNQQLLGPATIETLMSYAKKQQLSEPPSSTMISTFQQTLQSISSPNRVSMLQNNLLCFASSTWSQLLTSEGGASLLLVTFLHPQVYARALGAALGVPEEVGLELWEGCYTSLLEGFPDLNQVVFFHLEPASFLPAAHSLLKSLREHLEAQGRSGGDSPLLTLPSARRLRALANHHLSQLSMPPPSSSLTESQRALWELMRSQSVNHQG